MNPKLTNLYGFSFELSYYYYYYYYYYLFIYYNLIDKGKEVEYKPD